MTSSASWWASVALVACSCSIGVGSSPELSSVNQCSSDADCGQGHCIDGACVASGSRISTVLLELTPAVSDSSDEYAGMRFLTTVQLDTGGDIDVSLPVVTDMTVGMLPPQQDCSGVDTDAQGHVAVRVELLQTTGLQGVTAELFYGASGQVDATNRALLHVPPGTFDLYVQPEDASSGGQVVPDDPCTLAPLLIRRESIAAGNVSWEQRFPVARTLDIDVQSSPASSNTEDNPFQDWRLDLVDPLAGRRLSTVATLGEPDTDDQGMLHYVASIAYNPISGVDADQLRGSELVRLRPPTDVLEPTFYAARSTLDLFDTGQGVLDQVAHLPSLVTVEGRVESEDGAKAVPSRVTVEAKPANSDGLGVMMTFRQTVDTDDDGKFAVKVAAGTQRVTVVPLDDVEHAVLEAEWIIAPTPERQAGKLLALPLSSKLTGVVLAPSGTEPIKAATIHAIPSRLARSDTFIDSLLGNSGELGLRSATATVDAEGSFAMKVDLGNFDVTVRPPQHSGFPWAIRPSTTVAEGVTGLGEVQISSPFMYTGTVTVPGQTDSGARVALPGTLLRVFALFDADQRLSDDMTQARSAVELWESRCDSEGRFELLLPERLE